MLNNVFQHLEIEYPIFAFSHCRDVVAAVTNAGGIGIYGASLVSVDQMRIDLDWIARKVRGRSFGVDVLLPVEDHCSVTEWDSLRDAIPREHWEFVDYILAKYEVPELMSGDAAPPFPNISQAQTNILLDAIFDYPVRLVANALGPPPEDLITRAHEHNSVVAGLVGTPQQALSQCARGVDIVVAQGYEAGGHTGEIATMVLTPAVIDAVGHSTPVLAAGGIGSGRQMAAAMALGAAGVWTGSVWLTTEEAETSPVIQQKLLAAGVADTVRSRSLSGKTIRQLRTAWTEEWEQPSAPRPLPMPLQTILVWEAKNRIDQAAHHHEGARELAGYYVGQVVGLPVMSRRRTVKDVIFDMVDEYIEVASRLGAALERD